ncbi:hypothetical protein PGTUg99_023755 [Puccinia graminis f. sp. tritici]|uniref:Uncharacterized protein n=1 Tax=Puccinia graminis f. sp. tritici TaxID=56615 RepID=A0A5B0MVZ5_PUCGR|nr:hypothetical protein PGTUg99_023755 [Puccinia graminis f. sp. tritici]
MRPFDALSSDTSTAALLSHFRTSGGFTLWCSKRQPSKHHPFNQLPTAWHDRSSTFGPPSRDRTSDLKIYSLVLLGLLSGDRRRGQTCRADLWLLAEIKIVKSGPAVQRLSPLKVGPRFSLDYLRSSRYRKPLGIALRRREQSYRDESWLSSDPKISKIRHAFQSYPTFNLTSPISLFLSLTSNISRPIRF